MRYQLRNDDNGIMFTDESGALWSVPDNPDNRMWQAYQLWLADGNEPDPAE